MVLNYIWVAFFVIAFIVALCKLIFMSDVEIFTELVNSTFSSSKTAFEISLGLTGIYTHFITANLCEQINERGKEKTDAANQDKYGLVQQVDALCNADGNDTDNGRDGGRYQCGDKDVRGLGGTHLRAIHHDADGDKYQSRGVEDKEHYHRIGGSILFRV